MFSTARHAVLRRPQDAMLVWLEDLATDHFKLCLREARNFDGPHERIEVVNLASARNSMETKLPLSIVHTHHNEAVHVAQELKVWQTPEKDQRWNLKARRRASVCSIVDGVHFFKHVKSTEQFILL